MEGESVFDIRSMIDVCEGHNFANFETVRSANFENKLVRNNQPQALRVMVRAWLILRNIASRTCGFPDGRATIWLVSPGGRPSFVSCVHGYSSNTLKDSVAYRSQGMCLDKHMSNCFELSVLSILNLLEN
jgi:hypothetical protein